MKYKYCSFQSVGLVFMHSRVHLTLVSMSLIKGGWNKHGFILSHHPVGQKVNMQLGRLAFLPGDLGHSLLSPPPSS